MKRDMYRIRLVPEDGPTLLKRTRDEWSLGYLFKVLWSDSPLFRTGSRITIAEINDQEQYHPVVFEPEFETLTIGEHVAQQASHDYGFEEAAEYLMKVGE